MDCVAATHRAQNKNRIYDRFITTVWFWREKEKICFVASMICYIVATVIIILFSGQ